MNSTDRSRPAKPHAPDEADEPPGRHVRWWSRWWLDRSVLVKGLTVVAIPMLALVAVTSAGLALQWQERQERQVAIAANALTRAAGAVLADAVDAETGVRGYAATSDPLFLTPYTAALGRVQADTAALRSAATTEDDQARADVVLATVAEQFALLAQLRTSVQAGSTGPSLTSSLGAGKAVMDRLRVQGAVLADAPAQLAAQKGAEITRLGTVIQVVQISGLALGVLAVLAGVALFTSGISRRVRVATGNANRLGRGAQLVPTAPADDELGQLGESLAQAHRLLITREAELSAARDQALQASQAKNTFLSRTSHELRTPLNAVLGFAQLLELSELDQDDRDSTERILGAGRHLLALINELIDIAQIEAGELRLSVEPVGLHALTQEIGTLMRPLAAVRGITIEHRCADRTSSALADRQRLRQILINLVSNAVKYNRHGGVIVLEHGPGNDRELVQMSVADTGPGLSPADIERIFVPFERLKAEQHGIEGTGIGLPLALTLTEAMHGVLDVTSTPGSGSVFTVRLPRAASTDSGPTGQPAADPATSGRSGHRPAGHGLVVVSIEDNAANSEVLARFFDRRPGTTLYCADTAHAGIDLARRYPPDLVLLDLHLPDLPGEEVFARLRAEPGTANTPIVILSADATPCTIRRLLARGATGYLTKPLDLRELRDLLDRTVPQRHAHHQPVAIEQIAAPR